MIELYLKSLLKCIENNNKKCFWLQMARIYFLGAKAFNNTYAHNTKNTKMKKSANS